MATSDRIMGDFTILRKWSNLEGAYLICTLVAVQTLSLYNNLMQQEATLIATSRLLQHLIQHRIKLPLPRIAEVHGFVILYDLIQGRRRLARITRLLMIIIKLSLYRLQIILCSKNSSKKTQTQEIKQLKQFITIVQAKLPRRTNNYTRLRAYLKLWQIKVFTITKNIHWIITLHKLQLSEVALGHTLKTAILLKRTQLFNQLIIVERWNKMQGYYWLPPFL